MTDAPSDRPRRPWAAAVLSLLLPGLGQLYCGRPGRALLVQGLTLVPVVLLFGGGAATFFLLVAILALMPILYFGIPIDAVVLARRTTGFHLRWYNRWYIYLVLLVLFDLGGGPLLRSAVRSADLPFRTYSIPSASMEPTLQVGDFIMAGRAGAPRRGDIVIVEVEGRTVIERIVAVAGDEVEIRAKELFVNGRPAAEPWARHSDPTTYPYAQASGFALDRRDQLPPTRVPAGHLFVLGDNRDNSYDSRFYGPVPVAKLRGRPLYVYWSRDRGRIGTAFGR